MPTARPAVAPAAAAGAVPGLRLWEREWYRRARSWRRRPASGAGSWRASRWSSTCPTDRPRPRGAEPAGRALPRAGRRRARPIACAPSPAARGPPCSWRCSPSSTPCSGASPGRRGSSSAPTAPTAPGPSCEPVVGFFLTQVPFATDLAGRPDLPRAAGPVPADGAVRLRPPDLPVQQADRGPGGPPDPSRNPVVQALLLILEGESHGSSGELDFRPEGLYDGNSRWDLMFGVYDYHDVGLAGALEYNTDIFEADDRRPSAGAVLPPDRRGDRRPRGPPVAAPCPGKKGDKLTPVVFAAIPCVLAALPRARAPRAAAFAAYTPVLAAQAPGIGVRTGVLAAKAGVFAAHTKGNAIRTEGRAASTKRFLPRARGSRLLQAYRSLGGPYSQRFGPSGLNTAGHGCW